MQTLIFHNATHTLKLPDTVPLRRDMALHRRATAPLQPRRRGKHRTLSLAVCAAMHTCGTLVRSILADMPKLHSVLRKSVEFGKLTCLPSSCVV